jgi:hypothetical protein
MFHPTLTINGLHGGYDGPGSKTVLPCAAVAKCDIRLVPDMTPGSGARPACAPMSPATPPRSR